MEFVENKFLMFRRDIVGPRWNGCVDRRMNKSDLVTLDEWKTIESWERYGKCKPQN